MLTTSTTSTAGILNFTTDDDKYPQKGMREPSRDSEAPPSPDAVTRGVVHHSPYGNQQWQSFWFTGAPWASATFQSWRPDSSPN
ncbi:hypothetical protein N7462_002786 [Penicillium macrosclerotiorum]|uniref:uncharacterized protein n=1 Tax=Penicillium macrosclerotiorum TaxID=303699 RepID=UPI0025472CBA|nr:uncharacterized protein N7462_002786 [Penicillium macrosclerotiorum]KAJ5693363.1 hypothetical protein N7462_002786 [Penicillium macrosclerotiorum]